MMCGCIYVVDMSGFTDLVARNLSARYVSVPLRMARVGSFATKAASSKI